MSPPLPVLEVALGVVEVLPLKLYGGHPAPVADLEEMLQRRVVGDLLSEATGRDTADRR